MLAIAQERRHLVVMSDQPIVVERARYIGHAGSARAGRRW
jgi:hypothetical protein